MATTPTVPAPAALSISGFGRVIGVLTSPKETFADIARKPSFLLPIALLTICGLAFAFVMSKRVDWHDFMRQQIEKSPRTADMSAEQKERVIEQQTKFTGIVMWVIGGVAPLAASLILALIYWGAFNMFAGAGASFGQSWGVTAHGALVGLVSGPLGMIIMWMKSYGEVNPENIVASSLGALLSSDSPKWMMSIATSVELFWFWEMFLFAVGFAAINPKKISTGKALTIVGGIWVVWVLLKAGLAAAFS